MDLSWIRVVNRLLLGFVWFVCVPAIFAFFYTVIETQTAARVAVGSNARLAPFTISRLAHRLDVLEGEIDATTQKLTALDEDMRAARVKQTEAKQQSTAVINSVWITLNNTQPTCDLETCLNDIIAASEQRTWDKDAELLKRVALAQQLYDSYLNTQYLVADLDDRNRHAQAALAAAKAEYHGVQPAGAAMPPSGGAAADAQAPDQSSDGASDDASGDAPDGAPVDIEAYSTPDQKAVALTYNKQRAIPLFEFAFFLPSGVIVASFTGLMGAIGAAVYSLYVELGMLAAPKGEPDRTWMAFGVRPLLGALAGFTVFFVISAGASFLIQPQAIGATQAVNQLSPPALASLGLFAGLASENALRWLVEKANSFFKSTGEDEEGPAATSG